MFDFCQNQNLCVQTFWLAQNQNITRIDQMIYMPNETWNCRNECEKSEVRSLGARLIESFEYRFDVHIHARNVCTCDKYGLTFEQSFYLVSCYIII